jgi:hypothetical protein
MNIIYPNHCTSVIVASSTITSFFLNIEYSITLLICVQIRSSKFCCCRFHQFHSRIQFTKLMMRTRSICNNFNTIQSKLNVWRIWCEKFFTSFCSKTGVIQLQYCITNWTLFLTFKIGN